MKENVRAYETFQDLISDKELDVVDICTPSNLHTAYSNESMQAGKNVLVEKPMALSLADADTMIETSQKFGVTLMVAHVLRFFPDYAKAMKLSEDGRVGTLLISRAYRGASFPNTDSWLADYSRSGGVLYDLAIHDIDFLLACHKNPVRRVFAKICKLVHTDITAHDFTLINLEFEDGGLAEIIGSFALPKLSPFSTALDLLGTSGTIQLTNQNSPSLKLTTNDLVEEYTPETKSSGVVQHSMPLDPFVKEIDHFVDCVLSNKAPVTDGAISRKSLEVCEAALRSSKENAPVRVTH